MTIHRTAMTRRQLVGAAGASLAASALAGVFPAIAQSRTLKIGALISQADAQGQDEMIQPYDQQMKLGLGLAVAEINAAGGILGRQVELLIADDDGSPAPGAAAALKMIKEQGVEALVSGVVVAIRSFLPQLQLPLPRFQRVAGITASGGRDRVDRSSVRRQR